MILQEGIRGAGKYDLGGEANESSGWTGCSQR